MRASFLKLEMNEIAWKGALIAADRRRRLKYGKFVGVSAQEAGEMSCPR